MKKFLTLIKRDLNDNKGALIITPFAIVGFIFAIIVFAMILGKFNFSPDGDFKVGFDGGVHAQYQDDDGKTYKLYKENGVLYSDDGMKKSPVLKNVTEEDKISASRIFVLATASGTMLPIFVSMIAILFVLAGALYDERKERNIMFWKSLPISDFQTVGAKAFSTIVGGLGASLLAAMALHFALMILVSSLATIWGVNVLQFNEILSTIANFWGLAIVALIGYALWALPVYSWFLTASAFAPKAPFFWAILPIAILPLIAKIFVQDFVSVAMIPLQHLSGEPVIQALTMSVKEMKSTIHGEVQLTNIDFMPIFESFMKPGLWIGIIISIPLLYLAGEIRRRKAL